MDDEDSTAIRLLCIPSQHRTPADLAYLHAYLRTIEGLNVSGPTSAHRDAELRAICQIARHRRVPGDVILYRAGDFCDSWFILLTGSVLIETSMFLPRACFGLRLNGGAFRQNDCLVLEPSDLVVIDYPERDRIPTIFTNTHRQAITCHKRRLSHDVPTDPTQFTSSNESSCALSRVGHTALSSPVNDSQPPRIASSPSAASSPDHNQLSHTYSTTESSSTSSDRRLSNRSSKATARCSRLSSDTSSAQSITSSSGLGNAGGGSTLSDSGRSSSHMTSGWSDRKDQGAVCSPGDPTKGVVVWSKQGGAGDSSLLDSEDDEEDDFESSSHESLRDAFWESILKEPAERTEEDIQILMENVQQLPAFSNLTKATCRALCGVMVIAMVREAGQIVLDENEPLDTWSVVLSGTVEVIEPDGTIRELTRGDAFGIRLTMSERIHRGVMRTVTEDCQFVCVSQTDYVRIMSREGDAEVPEMGEGGRVVLVYEELEPDTSTMRSSATKPGGADVAPVKKSRLVTKGTPEKLIEHLVADLSNVDITYPEDFLLTYRTLLDSPRSIVDRLLSWHMHRPNLRSRVNRIVLLWVHNHFNDFEDSPEMMRFVEHFDQLLATDGTAGERRLFQLACSTKARARQIDLDLPIQYPRSTVSPPHSPHQVNSSQPTVYMPFTLIGGQDGFGIFVDRIDNQFASALAATSWNTSGKSSATSSTNSSSFGVMARPQLHRADQLLAVNGRSVEHLSPCEVVQFIQSLGSAAATDLPSSLTSSETIATSQTASNSFCTVRLLLIYNPVQYYQLLNTLGSYTSTGSGISHASSVGAGGDSVFESSSTGPNSVIESLVLDSCRLMVSSEASRLKKSNLPTSNSVSHDLGSTHLSPSLSRSSDSAHRKGSGPLMRARSRERRGPSALDNQLYCPYNGPSRSHSAHTSPSRAETKGRTEASTTHPMFMPTAHPSGKPLLRISSEDERSSGLFRPSLDSGKLTVADSQTSLHRSQRASSQPDLSSCVGLYPVLDRGFLHPFDCTVSGQSLWSVIRVWRSNDSGRDQSSKLVLLPRRQTNALEATRLAAEEFGVPEEDLDSYCLYHVTVEPGPIVKQSRLANIVDDLAGRMTLNARYYLKHGRSHEPLIADDVAKTILTESRVAFMQLAPEDLAIRLTLDDYEVFRAVQSTEYIDEVFGLSVNAGPECIATDSGTTAAVYSTGYATGHENLDRFTELVNREAYWAPTEICAEPNLNRRVELLKRFIKLAKLCRELRNFNTMFCLLVGLHQTPVERLKQTWERLPNKYQKMYRDLSMVLDTSRNFCQYRNLFVTSGEASAPMIPYLPLVLKDLTFIHLGNPSQTPDGLINFVKLRMLAKEIRAICRMCNVDYDFVAAQRLLRRSSVGSRTRAWAAGGSTKSAATSQKLLTAAMNGWEVTANAAALLDDYKRGDVLDEDRAAAIGGNRGSGLTSSAASQSKRPTLSTGGANSILTAAAAVGSASGPLLGFSSSMGGRRRSGGSTFGFGSSSVSVNAKKLYEAWLVTLRVRTYLANLCVNRDPESLSQLSARLEPGPKETKSNGSVPCPGSEDSTSSVGTSTITGKELKSPTKITPTTTGSVVLEKPIPPTAATGATSTIPACNAVTATVSSNTTQLTRPILGAQSLEDARKLLALSEGHKRSHHRIPAFTFPTVNPTCTTAPFVFIAPPAGPHAGVGLGPLQYQHHPPPHTQAWSHPAAVVISRPIQHSSSSSFSLASSQCPSASSMACSNPHHHRHVYHQHHHHQQPQQQQVPTMFTLMGSKSLLLDNLIPMPQRIGPSGAARCGTAAAAQRAAINYHNHQVVSGQRAPITTNHSSNRHCAFHHPMISSVGSTNPVSWSFFPIRVRVFTHSTSLNAIVQ
ncbi:hypothetical protein EG68_02574 [Paragonimus skrjabini miyazakii]|uniref:Rap guanine nucleotide exchange factor 2 n=1 Tax=Paragonimus skrjabini miyazakii TaxID=59628 RepID=A0A8S9Z3G3_9TREM|nr:hypothetical protein EG68_02574 [Paragonimus skrjabini miyazakii]